jgi:hypothetical protein
MARLVRQNADGKDADGIAARIAKYVPAEVLALYIAVENVLRELASGTLSPTQRMDQYLLAYGAGILFILCIVLIPLYLRSQEESNADKVFLHSIVSIVLFVVWIYAMKGAVFEPNIGFFGFKELSQWHSAALSTILMAIFTALSGLIPSKTLSELWSRKAPEPVSPAKNESTK